MPRKTSRFLKNKNKGKERKLVGDWLLPTKQAYNGIKEDANTRYPDDGKDRSKGAAQSMMSKARDDEFVKRIDTRLNILSKSLLSLNSKAGLLQFQPIAWRAGIDLEREIIRNQLGGQLKGKKNWKEDGGGSNRDVRDHLVERQLRYGWNPRPDSSELIHSLWKMLQCRNKDAAAYALEDSWFPPRLDFSTEVGKFLPSNESTEERLGDGRDFSTRLVMCRRDFLHLDQLICDIFGRSRNFEEQVYGCHIPEDERPFWPAEHAIQWARRHRHAALEL